MNSCVMLDPPWPERGAGKIKRGADRHYKVMPVRKMPKAIFDSGVWGTIAPSAHCWMWVTNNYLAKGMWLMEQIGFRYVTNVAWVKLWERGVYGPKEGGLTTIQVARSAVQIGLGQYLRGSHELMLFGVRGDFMKPDKAPPSVIFAERTKKHSQKPQESYDLIEKTSPGPYLEMFARSEGQGWTAWGDEV